MKAKPDRPRGLTLAAMIFMTLSCALPGLIPLAPLPKMERNVDTLIEVLNGSDWHLLQALAREQYSPEDFAKPGTLTFTVTITDRKPVYFSYGWCTRDAETLRQNLEHMEVSLYFNGDELGTDVVHPLSFSQADGQQCLDFGVLLSEWSPGDYRLKAVATFDEKIDDGFSLYEAGDYVYEYNVTVEESGENEGTSTHLLGANR